MKSFKNIDEILNKNCGFYTTNSKLIPIKSVKTATKFPSAVITL